MVLTEGATGRSEEVNRLLAGSNFGAGELLAGEVPAHERRNPHSSEARHSAKL